MANDIPVDERRRRKRERDRARYYANHEEAKAKLREYAKQNPRKAYKAAWETKNRERLKAQRAAYYQAHRDVIRARSIAWDRNNDAKRRATSQAHYEANEERIRKTVAAYYQKNKDRLRPYYQAALVRYRGRKQAAAGSFTQGDIAEIFRAQRGKCAYWRVRHGCKGSLAKGYDIDHIIPLSKGGTNDRRNLQLTCDSCNSAKQNRDPIDFARKLGRLL